MKEKDKSRNTQVEKGKREREKEERGEADERRKGKESWKKKKTVEKNDDARSTHNNCIRMNVFQCLSTFFIDHPDLRKLTFCWWARMCTSPVNNVCS